MRVAWLFPHPNQTTSLEFATTDYRIIPVSIVIVNTRIAPQLNLNTRDRLNHNPSKSDRCNCFMHDNISVGFIQGVTNQ
ncbi:MAG: hypothetical protein WCP16_17505 [Pseudanabaena sp. ELA645]